jgi:hypothetical protein
MPTLTPEIVEEVCGQFNRDGISIQMVSLDDGSGQLELQMDLIDVECVDCVMPTDYLERLIASSILKRSGRPFLVRLHDPRAVPAQTPPTAMSGSVIILDPTAANDSGDPSPGPDVGPLRGKTVLFRIDTLWRSWDWVSDEWITMLERSGVTVKSWRRTRGIPGDDGRRLQAEYEGLVDSADALISGLGNCGSCTAWTIRDALTGMSAGKPTLAVVTEHFVPLAKVLAEDGRYPGLRLQVLPYPLNNRPEDEVRAIARSCFDAMLSVLGASV